MEQLNYMGLGVCLMSHVVSYMRSGSVALSITMFVVPGTEPGMSLAVEIYVV